MDSVTISLPDLGEWGPYGYLVVYIVVTGIVSGYFIRHIRLSGITEGHVQESHHFRSLASAIVGVLFLVSTLCVSTRLFSRSIESADRNVEIREKIRSDSMESRNLVCPTCSLKH